MLAAGASRRFGTPKQLIRLEGRPILHSVVSRAVEIGGHGVTVVLGSGAADLAGLLRHTPASVVVNRDWQEGVASSIRTGVARLPSSCSGVMIALADQPSVTVEDFRRLAGAWRVRPDCLVVSQYGGIIGVPAVFPRWCFPDLLALRGDRGAQLLIHRHSDRVLRVPNPSAAIDIDTPEDLLALEPQDQPTN
ncbi:MAG: nucleotidyltransferase family protein [Steroidobacteraceae bacterium]